MAAVPPQHPSCFDSFDLADVRALATGVVHASVDVKTSLVSLHTERIFASCGDAILFVNATLASYRRQVEPVPQGCCPIADASRWPVLTVDTTSFAFDEPGLSVRVSVDSWSPMEFQSRLKNGGIQVAAEKETSW